MLLFPKASASNFYYFQICKKVAWQFKILAVLYFYRFIITVNLKLQQVLLVLELNEVRNFFRQISGFSIPVTFENIYQKFVIKKEHLSILYFSQGNFTNGKYGITIF